MMWGAGDGMAEVQEVRQGVRQVGLEGSEASGTVGGVRAGMHPSCAVVDTHL